MESNCNFAPYAREMRLDRLKGLLCLLMLLAHAVFSFGYEQTGSAVWKLISHAVNLTAFPGFLFCFGFVCQRAYLEKRDRAAVSGRLVKRFFLTLAAYYISALAAVLLGEGPFTVAALSGVMHLTQLSGLVYLLSFAVLFLLMLLFYNGLNRLLDRGRLVALAVAVSLGFAALPALGLDLPVTGMLIKVNESLGFPVLPYAGFFLLGAYLSRRRLSFDLRVGLFTVCAFAAFAACAVLSRALPKRFPPSFFWVLGGYLPVYALYLLAGVCRTRLFDAVLAPFGRSTLYYLTASNIILLLYTFISRRAGFSLPPVLYLPGYIALVLLCFGLLRLYQAVRRT